MKKILLFCLTLLPVLCMAQDYDFAKKIGGNTLYFYITSTGGKNGATVEVTYPGASEEAPWKGFARPSGQLAIPEKVTPDRAKGRNADPEDDDTTIYTVTSINYFAFSGCDRVTPPLKPPLPTTVPRNPPGRYTSALCLAGQAVADSWCRRSPHENGWRVP